MPTVVELLRRRAESQPTDRAYLFVADGPEPERAISYGELDLAARTVAVALTARGAAGRPVLVLHPPGLDYVASFFGCLYAGAIAVPAYPPDAGRWHRTLPRLRRLVADCGARTALGGADLAEAGPAMAERAPELAGLDWLAGAGLTGAEPDDAQVGDEPGDARVGDADQWLPPDLDGGAPALLQYTSGSTGDPRGVLLSHANLLHNAGLVSEGFGSAPTDVGVSWLPPYHDMGLIGGILQPLFAGFPVVLMPPLSFLRRPMAWLEAVSRHGATISGGPNFAFDLCIRKSTPQQRAALDLSKWRVAFCGAEPVRAQTMDRFAEAFAPAGFRPEAFYPCYGLAEATLIVTGGQPPRPVGDGRVSCGRPLGGQRLAVVEPTTNRPCPPGAEGEIWLTGPSVAQGYWGRPEDTAETFGAQLTDDPGHRYLRTGDLGVLDPTGELVVTGRRKDLIIVRGRNLYPPDLEEAVQAQVAGVRPTGVAAFPVVRGGEERVGLACELAAGSAARSAAGEPGPAALIGQIRRVLAEAAEVAVAAVVLLRPGRIPKTSSGKIQRYACRQAFADGTWAVGGDGVLGYWEDSATGTGAAGGDGQSARPSSADHRGTGEPPVPALIASVMGLSPDALPADRPLTQLGLDSVRAIEVQAALETRYGLPVSLSELLTGVTAGELAARCGAGGQPADRAQLGARVPAGAGSGRPAGEVVEPPTGDGQRALWLLQRWAPDSTAYQISRAARVRTRLDLAALERALRGLLDRHPVLRTRLPAPDGEPVPEVTDWAGPVLTRHDVAGLTEPALRQRVQAEADRPFDLERGPLLRVSVYTRAPDDHVLLLSVHHTVTDFWSMSVLVDELLAAYQADGSAGAPGGSAPRPPAGPVRDAAAEGDRAVSAVSAVADGRAAPDAGLGYWREQLAEAPAALELPTTYPRPQRQSFRGDSYQFRLEPALRHRLDEFARAAGASRFAVLAAGFAAVLARYAGEQDVVLGAPTAGRRADEHHRLGYFVNPVPLRVRVPAGTSFRELVDQVRQRVIGALEHPVPFPRLVEALAPVRDPGRPPLMQVMLVLQQPPAGRPDLGAFAVADESAAVRLAGLELSPYRLRERGAAFEASLTLAEVAGGLTGELTYCTDLFDEPAIARLAAHLRRLLAAALTAPDAAVAGLALLDEAERGTVLALGGGPVRPYPDRTTLHAWFTARAAANPTATAVVAGGQQLSYAALDQRADRLAGLLTGRYGVRRGELVAVCLPRGLDAVVAFWAALKSGGGYAPVPPDLPPARLAWLLADARPAVVLTHRELADALPADGPARIYLDEPWPAGPPTAEEVVTGPDDLAYVLYTSGSTGTPKAVALTHRGACNLAESLHTGMSTTADAQVLQFASCAYDVHVADLLQAHLSGACLHVPPPAATVPGRALVDFLTEHRISHAIFSPSVLAALPDAPLPALRHILCGGEALPPEVVARWAPGRQFRNAYGPTETTVCVTWVDCDPADPRRPTLGAPMPNVRIYVLDEALQPVPVGVPGELCVGGVAVGRGYLGRPGLTAQQFVADPYAPAGGGRLYRTGDRARWLPDGTLDFLGRLDDQVKIRGIRVEPGEVAARLRELLGIDEVAVVARPAPGGGEELVAYLAGAHPRRSVAELRGRLRAQLPAPWLPAAFVQLAELPLNRSGKLDRRALPAPAPGDRGLAAPLAPRTELERTVAQVWAAVLGQPSVGVRDHFFDELGGSSLLVARVTSELSRRLARDVPVTWLFEHPTVESLARRLAGAPAADPADPAGPRPEDQAERRRRALARRNAKERP